jgi:hypothetical protein
LIPEQQRTNELADVGRADEDAGVDEPDMQAGEHDGQSNRDCQRVESVEEGADTQRRGQSQVEPRKRQALQAGNDLVRGTRSAGPLRPRSGGWLWCKE